MTGIFTALKFVCFFLLTLYPHYKDIANKDSIKYLYNYYLSLIKVYL